MPGSISEAVIQNVHIFLSLTLTIAFLQPSSMDTHRGQAAHDFPSAEFKLNPRHFVAASIFHNMAMGAFS